MLEFLLPQTVIDVCVFVAFSFLFWSKLSCFFQHGKKNKRSWRDYALVIISSLVWFCLFFGTGEKV